MSSKKKTTKSKPIKNNNIPVSLSSREICKIIKECRANGVLSLNIDGLDLKLGEVAERAPIPFPQPRPQPVESPEDLPLAAHKKDAFDGNELLELEASELCVTDPEMWEAISTAKDLR